MIGLGCGARSYTRALHYSPAEYAVAAAGVRAVLDGYLAAEPDDSTWPRSGLPSTSSSSAAGGC